MNILRGVTQKALYVSVGLLIGAVGTGLAVTTVNVPPANWLFPKALDVTAVTVSGTAVVALTGPTNGCNISSTTALIIDPVNTAGTSVSNTSQLQPANAAPYQCGTIGPNVQISVNCSGGGTCSWTGTRW